MNNALIVLLLAAIMATDLNAADSLPPLKESIEDSATGLNLQPGFAAEMIYKVDKSKYGSWITLVFDNQGRLIVSDQRGAGVFRMTVNKNRVKRGSSHDL